MNMFCYQCEQASKGTGCTVNGVCGKDPQTAALQDLLIYALKDISRFAHRARINGTVDNEINIFTIDALFSTLTNVNFDPLRFQQLLQRAAHIRQKAEKLYRAAGSTSHVEVAPPPIKWWQSIHDVDTLIDAAQSVGIQNRISLIGDEITGLQELIVYGLKGVAAYAYHAHILGKQNDDIFAFIHKTLDFLSTEPADINALLQAALDCGKINLTAMEQLDAANTETYGHPEPTNVRVTPVKGKCIVVSGHDLKDLEEVLKQTQGKGINVYTHGEMLPCNAYPGLKKYKHLVGNYGGAWQEQHSDFEKFPGAILMTTNCLQKPKDSYINRIFSSDVVGSPGVTHIATHNFEPLIQSALSCAGFKEDAPEKSITIGFARNTVLNAAGKVVELIKSGKIKHFFLIGGCDGAKPGRNYFTEFAQSVPNDCVILTLACGKYRFNKLQFGQIDGIPRLLDCGQCNDAYSAIQIAVALANAFGCGVNDLPLSMILSWYEQKAVAILLTLLYLGIKNIKLGPSLPAFVRPGALKVLVDTFNIAPTTDVKSDLASILK